MEKGKIIYRENLPYPELQTYFISEAENNHEYYIEKYKQMSKSLNGRFIDSDLMKETFDLYSANADSRKKYNLILHNSAAVLANELFTQMLNTYLFKKCIFLSGAPGTGKTFFIQSLALTNMLGDDTIIFEGNITTPYFLEKLEFARKCGVEPSVVVVNAPLELAAENVVRREKETGRDVRTVSMAKIFSEIPKTLSEMHKRYPDIDLAIYDKKSNYDVECLFGFEQIDVLKHGSYEEILVKLLQLRSEFEEQLAEASELEIDKE